MPSSNKSRALDADERRKMVIEAFELGMTIDFSNRNDVEEKLNEIETYLSTPPARPMELWTDFKWAGLKEAFDYLKSLREQCEAALKRLPREQRPTSIERHRINWTKDKSELLRLISFLKEKNFIDTDQKDVWRHFSCKGKPLKGDESSLKSNMKQYPHDEPTRNRELGSFLTELVDQ